MLYIKFGAIDFNKLNLSFFSSCVLTADTNYAGFKSKLDVGVITGQSGEHHFFINVADIHL